MDTKNQSNKLKWDSSYTVTVIFSCLKCDLFNFDNCIDIKFCVCEFIDLCDSWLSYLPRSDLFISLTWIKTDHFKQFGMCPPGSVSRALVLMYIIDLRKQKRPRRKRCNLVIVRSQTWWLIFPSDFCEWTWMKGVCSVRCFYLYYNVYTILTVNSFSI